MIINPTAGRAGDHGKIGPMIRRKAHISAGAGLRIVAAGLAFLAGVGATPPASETTLFRASYVISLGGIVVGHASAESRFSGGAYVASINGSTSGVTRMVTDASARLSGSGRIAGSKVLPSSYKLDTKENGFNTHVTMEMQSGRITDLVALPNLARATDRIPVTATHKTGIVDPLGAFILPLDRPGIPSGRVACNRTVKVFDGWTRFDVELSYKETKAVDGRAGMYVGRVIVCGARYVPVAGHRTGFAPTMQLAENESLEIWFVPVKNQSILVPYRIVVETRVGPLMIYATRFSTDGLEKRAQAN
jgi:hypothetical protein